jgi:hypothetical protein
MLISGPRNSAGLGNELGTTSCMLLVGQGGDHLTSSMIYHDSARTCIPNILNIGGALSGSSATFSCSVTATRLSLNNTGTAARLQVNGVNSEPIAYLYNNSGTAGSVPGVAIEAGTNSSDYALNVASSLGASRLYIRGDGNIGIGNTNPQIKLDLQNGNVGFYNNAPSSNGAQLYLGDMNFAGGAYATSAPGIGSIASPQTGVSGDLAFYVYASAVCSRSEAMRIVRTSSGNNVGIATTCPTATLQIGDGSANSFLRIRAADGGAIVFNKGADNSAFIGEVQAGLGSCNGLLLYTYSGAERPIILYTAGTEKMRITGGGYVGIGTNNPSAPLHIVGNQYIGKLGGGGNYKQTVVGQTTAATSGSSKKIAYVGFTHAVRVYVWANQSTPDGATAIADFTTLYGSSNGGVTYSATLGNVSGISIAYDNGGSPVYTINVTLTYSGAAPTINYIIEGINHDNFIYAL